MSALFQKFMQVNAAGVEVSSEIATETVSVTTTGSAGTATGSAVSGELNGFLLDIYLDFHASAPATTDTTIAHTEPTMGNILVVSNSATDALITPRAKAVDSANAAITNSHDKVPLDGTVTISLAECDALTNALVARIRYLRTV